MVGETLMRAPMLVATLLLLALLPVGESDTAGRPALAILTAEGEPVDPQRLPEGIAFATGERPWQSVNDEIDGLAAFWVVERLGTRTLPEPGLPERLSHWGALWTIGAPDQFIFVFLDSPVTGTSVGCDNHPGFKLQFEPDGIRILQTRLRPPQTDAVEGLPWFEDSLVSCQRLPDPQAPFSSAYRVDADALCREAVHCNPGMTGVFTFRDVVNWPPRPP